MDKRNAAAIRLKTYRFAAIMVLAALIIVIAGCQTGGTAGNAARAESVYDRVMRTGVIRAAYLTYPPACMPDPSTGDITGTFVEVLEQMATNLGLEVEWTEEVGWGSQIEGLVADRYDIVGSPVWANPTRGKLTTMSRPVYYSGIGVYVRESDDRFDENWEAVNSPDVRIATIDGETGDLLARTQFPQAQRVSLPQLTDISQLFLEVSSNKADVLFAEPYFADAYFRNNEKSMKNIAEETPIRVLGNCYMFKSGEFEMKHMLDTALEDLLNSGFVTRLLARYEGGHTFYEAANPYKGH